MHGKFGFCYSANLSELVRLKINIEDYLLYVAHFYIFMQDLNK